MGIVMEREVIGGGCCEEGLGGRLFCLDWRDLRWAIFGGGEEEMAGANQRRIL